MRRPADVNGCRAESSSSPSQRNDIRLEADEFFQHRLHHHHHHLHQHRHHLPSSSVGLHHGPTLSHYQRMQYRRMYRYGLSLLLVGALCNWIGFAQHYFAPVRYLGVGCVVAGALCICIALGRWLSVRSSDSPNHIDVTACGAAPGIHVITVPIQQRGVIDPFQPDFNQQSALVSKPPDYDTAIGSKPPSYDEAVRISPAVFLQQQPERSTTSDPNQPPCCYSIDCPRCGGAMPSVTTTAPPAVVGTRSTAVAIDSPEGSAH